MKYFLIYTSHDNFKKFITTMLANNDCQAMFFRIQKRKKAKITVIIIQIQTKYYNQIDNFTPLV